MMRVKLVFLILAVCLAGCSVTKERVSPIVQKRNPVELVNCQQSLREPCRIGSVGIVVVPFG
jgi:hypothetical protein